MCLGWLPVYAVSVIFDILFIICRPRKYGSSRNTEISGKSFLLWNQYEENFPNLKNAYKQEITHIF